MSRAPTPLSALAVVSAGLALSGCTVWDYAWLTCVQEPSQFCAREDAEVSLATYRAMADRAWFETGCECPDDCVAGDFAWGFREGFAQFVYAGGSGEPPVTPPRPYWNPTSDRLPAPLRCAAGSRGTASEPMWLETGATENA